MSAVLAGAAVLGCVAVARTPEGGPRTAVVVAARDLPAGHLLRPGDLVAQQRPAGFAPGRPVHDPGEVSGRRLAAPVTAGEVLTAGRVLGPGLLDGRDDGARAVHVPVADAGALAMVGAGDTVDLLASTGEVLASAVTVLSVDTPSGSGGLTGVPGTGGGIVAAVDDRQAARLASAPPDAVGGAGLVVVLRGSPSLR
ncbi:Flp pilus assembly protein CpaB [Pedococcus cremeus]|uniref:Flp pilus assembly protein CpaB n=1 Tax=Pedococcus cremeus TaxID=587636 RepID=A0A1H9XI71_9MICO|nr:SAF domain-containing protein [Pedococcus cremeus]SES45896.1 Flp pilus assembly protein CpaB [Pedococcus cremeus]